MAITCSKDLPVEVGASEDCALQQDGKNFSIKIRIAEVNSPDDISLDWEIGAPR